MFVHLHGHSQFSLLEAIGSSKAIIGRLKELGFTHAPITDYNGMYNIITHYEICKKEGMSPIIGVDLAIQVVNQNKAIRTSRFCTLLAKNYDGYLTLLQIVSQAQTANKMQEPHILLSSLPDLQGNIIALINAYETPMGDMIGSGRTVEDLTPILQTYKEVFGEENVVLEIIPQSKQENKQLSQANLVLRDLAQATQTPIIASNNFHYIRQSDQDAANIARCIKDGKRVYDEDRRVFQGQYHIMSEEEIMAQCWKNDFSPEQAKVLLDTTEAIANQINIEIPLHKLLFPVYESPEEIKELYEKFQNQE